MSILKSHPGPSDLETLGVGPSSLYFHTFSGDSEAPLGLRTTGVHGLKFRLGFELGWGL